MRWLGTWIVPLPQLYAPPPLHACAAQRERNRHDDHERAVENQGQGCALGDAQPQWEAFFREDQGGEEHHRRDVHHAQGEKKHEEQPVTSQAIDAMLQTHAKGASITLTPGRKDEIQGRAAFRQAVTFERGELVDPGQHEDATADAGRVQHDPGHLLGQSRGGVRAEIRKLPEECPDQQVRANEDPRGPKRMPEACPVTLDPREGQNHRGSRGKHHRDHHHNPDCQEYRGSHSHG